MDNRYDSRIVNRFLTLLSFLPVILLVLAFTSCTTVENYRSLYFPQTVWGPYTRMLHHGIPKPTPYQTTLPASTDGKSVITPQ